MHYLKVCYVIDTMFSFFQLLIMLFYNTRIMFQILKKLEVNFGFLVKSALGFKARMDPHCSYVSSPKYDGGKSSIYISHYRKQVTKIVTTKGDNKMPQQNVTTNCHGRLLQQIGSKWTALPIILFIFLMVNDVNVHELLFIFLLK